MWDTFFEQAARLRADAEPFAFATVVACKRPNAADPGAKAIIKADGTLRGWVGGSCAQPTVIREALNALADGKARLLRISPDLEHDDVPQEGVYDVVMTCASQGAYDEEALGTFIDTSVCYIGLVASEKRVASIFRYLHNKGVEPELQQRVTCPAGLRLGAVTPPEIAFSIMGEILQLTRGSVGKAAPATRPALAADVGPDMTVVDPVCGMTVHISGARYTSEYTGKTFAFCCASCKEGFDREPEQYGVGAPE